MTKDTQRAAVTLSIATLIVVAWHRDWVRNWLISHT